MKKSLLCLLLMLSFLAFQGGVTGCSGADSVGIGAQCTQDSDCKEEGQKCFTQFKGGYCSSQDCKSDSDCASGAVCVTHTDGKNYCFRGCADKVDCNANRDATNESNCSGNITLASGKKGTKACVPPSGS